MDGYEATKRIRSNSSIPNGSTVPIIAFTANEYAQEMQESFSLGFQGFITKPLTKEKLNEILNTYFA